MHTTRDVVQDLGEAGPCQTPRAEALEAVEPIGVVGFDVPSNL